MTMERDLNAIIGLSEVEKQAAAKAKAAHC